MGKTIRLFVCAMAVVVACGCGERRVAFMAREALVEKSFGEAVSILEKKARRGGKDKLCHLLDLGMLQHVSGDFEKSTRTFREAASLIEEYEGRAYVSVRDASAAGTSMLFNERVLPYKGEYFERVMVNVFLTLNALMQGRLKDAFVEAKRAYERDDFMMQHHSAAYQRCASAVYLWALVLELTGDYSNAAAMYRRVAQLRGSKDPALREVLLRCCMKAKMRWKDDPSLSSLPRETVDRVRRTLYAPEVVVLVECGLGPVKKESSALVPTRPPMRVAVPVYEKVNNPVVGARLRYGSDVVGAFLIDDLESIAIKTLSKRMKILLAKEAGRLAIKHELQKKAAKKSKFAGILVAVTNVVTERADTRFWATMPASIQVVRKVVDGKGKDLLVEILGKGGMVVGTVPVRVPEGIDKNDKLLVVLRTAGATFVKHERLLKVP